MTVSPESYEERRRQLWSVIETAAATTARIESMLIQARKAEDAARDVYHAHLKGIPPELAQQYAELEAARVAAARAAIESKSDAANAADIARQMIARARVMVEHATQARLQSISREISQ